MEFIEPIYKKFLTPVYKKGSPLHVPRYALEGGVGLGLAAISPDVAEMVGAVEEPAWREADALRGKIAQARTPIATVPARQQLVGVLTSAASALRNMLEWVEQKEDRAYISGEIKNYEGEIADEKAAIGAAGIKPSDPGAKTTAPGQGKKVLKGVGIAAAVAAGLGAVWLVVSSLRGK